ncbi:MAG: dihydroorotate oxidase [Solirubrobacteraceae bacterium]
MEISAHFANQKLENCLMNASGAKCMTGSELSDLINSPAGAVVSKSSTINFREGNPLPRYIDLDLGSINSMGLPNLGIDFYLDFAQKNIATKPIFISVAGLTLEENLALIDKINKTDANFAIELNLSCPNIPGKPQTAYDFIRTQEVLTQVFKINKKSLGVKLPPYFDMVHFEEVAKILNQFPLAFVTCINSVGNGLFIDAEKEEVVIKPKDGFGGLGGDYIKPTALANVRMFYNLLRKDIAVIGCGGIKSGIDIFEHILCGATAVQIGTQFMKEDCSIFNRLQDELKNIMQKKGYNKLEDFKGKLKSL